MKLGMSQSIRTSLQLRLSPQMLQRIEVLQLSSLDLRQLIEQELQENETLEQQTDDPTEMAEADAVAETGDGDGDGDGDVDAYDGEDEWEDRTPGEGPSRMDVMVATTAAPETLADNLGRQLDMLDLPERQLTIARAIMLALNERGWLSLPLSDVGAPVSPPATAAELEQALHVVQRLEPAGIGARDLTECLLLQLSADNLEYELLVSLVIHHLDDIARNRIPRIARESGASVDRVLAAIEVISHLDPIPGRRFSGARAPQVRPDVVVRRVGEDFEISIENDWVPNLVLSRSYRQMARDRSVDPELRKHIRGKLDGAQSLIEAIEQRKNTLFRVASELVNRQADFLEHGPSGLHPLRMQEVADALAVHVSTVSRAISGKYMQTPRGIIPMKLLFTGEIPSRAGSASSTDGDETASRAGVQELVRGIIGAEDVRDPLSDESIVEILKTRHGLDIARRTVTKYRKALRLGSSRDRRVYGQA